MRRTAINHQKAQTAESWIENFEENYKANDLPKETLKILGVSEAEFNKWPQHLRNILHLSYKFGQREAWTSAKEIAEQGKMKNLQVNANRPFKTLRRLMLDKGITVREISQLLECSETNVHNKLGARREFDLKEQRIILDRLGLGYKYLQWVFPEDIYQWDESQRAYINKMFFEYSNL